MKASLAPRDVAAILWLLQLIYASFFCLIETLTSAPLVVSLVLLSLHPLQYGQSPYHRWHRLVPSQCLVGCSVGSGEHKHSGTPGSVHSIVMLSNCADGAEKKNHQNGTKFVQCLRETQRLRGHFCNSWGSGPSMFLACGTVLLLADATFWWCWDSTQRWWNWFGLGMTSLPRRPQLTAPLGSPWWTATRMVLKLL